jgi:hypothetical protein
MRKRVLLEAVIVLRALRCRLERNRRRRRDVELCARPSPTSVVPAISLATPSVTSTCSGVSSGGGIASRTVAVPGTWRAIRPQT